jgi:hypothetical protein
LEAPENGAFGSGQIIYRIDAGRQVVVVEVGPRCIGRVSGTHLWLRGGGLLLVGWGLKDIEGKKAAYAELQRPRVGRLARISGTVEEMFPPEVID